MTTMHMYVSSNGIGISYSISIAQTSASPLSMYTTTVPVGLSISILYHCRCHHHYQHLHVLSNIKQAHLLLLLLPCHPTYSVRIHSKFTDHFIDSAQDVQPARKLYHIIMFLKSTHDSLRAIHSPCKAISPMPWQYVPNYHMYTLL